MSSLCQCKVRKVRSTHRGRAVAEQSEKTQRFQHHEQRPHSASSLPPTSLLQPASVSDVSDRASCQYLGIGTLDRAAESACAVIVAPGAEKFERCVETLSGYYIIRAFLCGVTHSLLELKYIQE